MNDSSTFVLVPGAGGDPWFWHRVIPLLPRAVAVDLPGPDPDAGLAAYADRIVQAARDTDGTDGTDGVVLVAQSMGGFSAPLACDRLDVRGIVLVNAMVPSPGESAGAWWEAVGQGQARREAEAAAGRDPDADFDVVAGFFHDVPDELTKEAFARGERDESERAFSDPWPLAAWPDVATTVVSGAEDRLFPLALQQRVARERLGLEPVVVPGGHLAAFSEPEALAAAILAAPAATGHAAS